LHHVRVVEGEARRFHDVPEVRIHESADALRLLLLQTVDECLQSGIGGLSLDGCQVSHDAETILVVGVHVQGHQDLVDLKWDDASVNRICTSVGIII
jgi:hypothetical protein